MDNSVFRNWWFSKMGNFLCSASVSKNLPGKTRPLSLKVLPGAGSTKGAESGSRSNEPGVLDGTVMFGPSGPTQFHLPGDPRVRYEYADWNPVMASGTGGVAYLNPEAAEEV